MAIEKRKRSNSSYEIQFVNTKFMDLMGNVVFYILFLFFLVVVVVGVGAVVRNRTRTNTERKIQHYMLVSFPFFILLVHGLQSGAYLRNLHVWLLTSGYSLDSIQIFTIHL